MQPDDPTDLRHPDFDGWRLIRQPGTSHDGRTRWEQLEPRRARVIATDDHGTRRSWLVVIVEEDRSGL